jgi:prevent-host-death family protein
MNFTIHKAKTHLSKILHQVEAGEEVTLCRGAVPVAKIVPWGRPDRKPRTFGLSQGLWKVGTEFFEADREIAEIFGVAESPHTSPPKK